MHTKNDVKTWQTELKSIPTTIETLRASSAAKKGDKAKEDIVLSEIRAVIKPFDETIASIDAQLTYLDNIEKRIPELEQAIQREQEASTALAPEITRLTQEVQSSQSTLNHFLALKKIQTAHAKQKTCLAEIKKARSTLTAKNREHENQASTCKELTEQLETLKANLKSLETAEEKYQASLVETKSHTTVQTIAVSPGQTPPPITLHTNDQTTTQISVLTPAVKRLTIDTLRPQESRPESLDLHVYQVTETQSIRRDPGFFEQLTHDLRVSYIRDHQRDIATTQSALTAATQALTTSASDIDRTNEALSSSQETLENQVRLLAEESDDLKLEAGKKAPELVDREIDFHLTGLPPLRTQLHTLSMQSSRHSSTEKRLTNEKDALHSQNVRLVKTAGVFANTLNTEDLNKTRSETNHLKDPHAKQEAIYQTRVDGLQQEIDALERNISRLTEKLAELNRQAWIFQLRDNPMALATSIAERCHKAIDTFIYEHPANQTEAEQRVMMDLRTDIDFILTHSLDARPAENTAGTHLPPTNPEYQEGEPGAKLEQKTESADADLEPANPERQRVYELAGLVSAKRNALSSESPLRSALSYIMQDYPLEGAADYAKQKRPTISSDELQLVLVDALSTALQKLRKAADTYRQTPEYKTLVNEADDLAKSISKSLTDSETSDADHPKFDTPYFTTLLIAAHTLLNSPANLAAQTRFAQLSRMNTLGQYDATKRLYSTLSIFLGAAVTTASYFSGNKPARFTGYGIGLSAVANGVRLFFGSRESGPAKASTGFFNAAKSISASGSAPQATPAAGGQVYPHVTPSPF